MHAAPALPELQRLFLAALYDDGEPGPLAAIVGHGLEPAARLRIYRNSCNEIQTGALRATYPAVRALVGTAFFEQTARAYRHAQPSTSGNLQGFGADFAEYLATLPALHDFAYIPDVARLEWRRQLAALATDIEPLPFDRITQGLACSKEPLAIALHPSVQVLASRHPVLTIWHYATQPTPAGLRLNGTRENVVLWREDGEVAMATPDAASFACIETWRGGDTLSNACAAAFAIDPDFDWPTCLGSLVERGLIVAPPTTPHEEPSS